MSNGETRPEVGQSRSGPPPLRIHHLLACAVVASVLFLWWRNAIPAELRAQLPATAVVLSAIVEVVSAVGFTFAVFSVYWHLKGFAGLVQPGQWLMLRRIIYVVQIVFGRIVVSHLRVTGPWHKSLWDFSDIFVAVWSILYTILVIVVAALPVLFYLWCALRVADTRPWRVLFSLAAIRSLIDALPLVRIFAFLLPGWPLERLFALEMVTTSILLLSVMGWIVWNERRLRLRRFWTHWLGVGLYAANEALNLSGGVIEWVWY